MDWAEGDLERGEMTPPAEKEAEVAGQGTRDSNPDVLMALAGRLPDDVLKIIQRHPLQYIALLRDLRDHDAEELDRIRGSLFDGLPTMSDRVKSPPPVGSLSEILDLGETNDKGEVPLAAVTTSNKWGLLEVVEELRQKPEEEQGVK